MIVYLIEALAIAIAAYYIPQTVLSKTEIFKIALTGAISYLLLDLFSPIVSSGLRFGTGMSIGKNMINAKSPPSLFGNVVSKGGKNNNICLDECMANGTESEVCNIMCANGYELPNLSGGYPLELSGGENNCLNDCMTNGTESEVCNIMCENEYQPNNLSGGENNCLDECMANGTESEVCNIMCANGYEPLNLSGGYPLELSGGKINKAFCDENGIPPELCNEINDEQQGGVNCYKKNVKEQVGAGSCASHNTKKEQVGAGNCASYNKKKEQVGAGSCASYNKKKEQVGAGSCASHNTKKEQVGAGSCASHNTKKEQLGGQDCKTICLDYGIEEDVACDEFVLNTFPECAKPNNLTGGNICDELDLEGENYDDCLNELNYNSNNN